MSGDRAVMRAAPAGQTLDELRRFEFSPDAGAWEWLATRPGPCWDIVKRLTKAGRLGPCSTVAMPEASVHAWCAPRRATDLLGVLRGAGVAEEMVYRVHAERGRPLPGVARLVSGAGSTLCSPASGAERWEPRAERPEPTPVQRRAISSGRDRRRADLEPLRAEVAERIGEVGWARARPVVEAVLGREVPAQRGAWWSEVGARSGRAILDGLGRLDGPQVEQPTLHEQAS